MPPDRTQGIFLINSSGGWPSFLQFEYGPGDRPAEGIILPPMLAGGRVQLYWAGADGSWDRSRSISLSPPGRAAILPLADLPHWDGSDIRAVRIAFPTPGPVALGAPALLR